MWPTLQLQRALPLTSASHRSTSVNITAGRPLSLRPQAQALDTNQEPRIKACSDYFTKKGGGGAAVGKRRVEKDRGMPLITCPPVCLSLHFRLQWTYVEATQCDKRVILRVRRQSLHSHSISGRSQQPSRREKQGGKGHSSVCRDAEVGEKRVGHGDQGVCKEDVSWRLGLSYRIHLETNWFLSCLNPPPEMLIQLVLSLISVSHSPLPKQMLSYFHAELCFDMFFLSSVCCCRFAEQRRACTPGNTAAGRGQRAPWTVAFGSSCPLCCISASPCLSAVHVSCCPTLRLTWIISECERWPYKDQQLCGSESLSCMLGNGSQ